MRVVRQRDPSIYRTNTLHGKIPEWLSLPFKKPLKYLSDRFLYDCSSVELHFSPIKNYFFSIKFFLLHKMFSNILDLPLKLLQIVVVWEVPVKNPMLRRLYNFCRVLISLIFAYVPNILLIAYLTTVDDIDVSITCFTENYWQCL